MAKLTKKRKAVREKIGERTTFTIDEAVALLSEFSSGKFKESLDVAVNLGVDPRKSD